MRGDLQWAYRLVRWTLLATLVLLAVSWRYKGRLVEPEHIESALLRPPVQESTSRAAFDFDYKGQSCRVRPVASYELAGLVVSHNDIESFADIYHDSSSVDTKDLCVVWGSNLRTGSYRPVDFSSGPFTCYFSIPGGTDFDLSEAGNNHLITDDAAVRETIARIRVGDQVRLRGLLVDYQMSDWREFWRETSTRRKDSDCEVVFVEQIEILRAGNPGWYLAHSASRAVLVCLPVIWLWLLWIDSGRSSRSARRP
jgi:hypothetical protein